jgi:type III restriction enzyme
MLKDHGVVWYVDEKEKPFSGQEVHLWEQYLKLRKQYTEYGNDASDQAKAIGSKIQQVDLKVYKSPWNVLYASYEPERQFSELLFQSAELFDAFVKMPNQGGYSFPYSYKPAKTAKTHTANENFNPDYFIRVRGKHDILVVEIKAEEDDSNRNRAKCRDGLKHFETLNERLSASKEPWRYHFYFLSAEDYTKFFEKVREGKYAGWKSGLMQSLSS